MTKKTVCADFHGIVRDSADHIREFHKDRGAWRELTMDEIGSLLEKLTLALSELGVRRGVPVAILAHTRPEWLHLDLATLSAGGITVGVYDTLPTDEVRYIVEHSEAKIVVLEHLGFLEQHGEAIFDCPQVERIVIIEPGAQPDDKRVIAYDQLIERGAELAASEPDRFDALVEAVEPDDVATYMYTSGTTGRPKAAILTHRALCETATASREALPLNDGYVGLIFLPLSHILQRVSMYFAASDARGSAYWAESIDALVDNIAEVRPTVMSCVPRIFEKIHTKVMARVESSPLHRRMLFHWAVGVGRQVSRCQRGRTPVPLHVALQHRLADRLVLKRIRNVLGGRCQFFGCGGAPLNPEIAEFFHACGVLILEGYGLSETSAITCVNRQDNFKFGTVGPPVAGNKIRIADDGEILIQGPGVFSGYLKDEAATARALKDGWFYTGDIGHLDEDGFLMITDRKKDLIVTAGGKNIAPQKIENRLKQHPLVSQVMVHGDRRKFLSALITLDAEEIGEWAAVQGIAERDPEKLTRHPQVLRAIDAAVAEVNATLPRFETLKKHAVLPRDFSIEGGELTPSLKVKRREVTRRYQGILDGFYS